jgi:hypothetical protein
MNSYELRKARRSKFYKNHVEERLNTQEWIQFFGQLDHDTFTLSAHSYDWLEFPRWIKDKLGVLVDIDHKEYRRQQEEMGEGNLGCVFKVDQKSIKQYKPKTIKQRSFKFDTNELVGTNG